MAATSFFLFHLFLQFDTIPPAKPLANQIQARTARNTRVMTILHALHSLVYDADVDDDVVYEMLHRAQSQ